MNHLALSICSFQFSYLLTDLIPTDVASPKLMMAWEEAVPVTPSRPETENKTVSKKRDFRKSKKKVNTCIRYLEKGTRL